MSKLKVLDALQIEVRQAGVLQESIIVSLQDARRTVRFGSGGRNDLRVPFSNVPSSLALFRLDAGRVSVLLEPRINGYINTGSEFGSVADFLSPEGAIERLAAIEDPLDVPLNSGSRGVLEIGDFDIQFKIERPRPEPPPAFILTGAKASAFLPSPTDTALEAASPILGIIFALLVFIPATIWLTASPQKHITNLSELPTEFIAEFIHPDHFRFLPKIYGDQYLPQEAPHLAVEWIRALQNRWHNENLGRPSESEIPILEGFYRVQNDSKILGNWKLARENSLQLRRETEQNPLHARFYEFATGFPDIVTETSGGMDGSLYLQQLQRIKRLDSTYASLSALIESEQKFLSDYYEERGLKREKSFVAPSGEREVEHTDEAFQKEEAAFQSAEGWAQIASASPYFAAHNNAQARQMKLSRSHRAAILWLSPKSNLFPKFLNASDGHATDPEATLVQNAKYSLKMIEVPPPPAPQATINRKAVDLVILDRREEVRGCYEDVLSRDPNLEGSMTMTWWIDGNGRAKNVRVASTSLSQPRLIRCIETLILNWNFPKSRNGAVKVEYPFRFVVEK